MYKINPCVAEIELDQQSICNLCKKKVFDFTGMSNKEVVALAEKNNGNICGKSDISFMNTAYYLHPFRRFALALLIVFGSSVFTLSAQAQDTIAKIQRDTLFSKPESTIPTQIKGTVIDEKTNEPIAFANVWIENDGQIIGASTDFDGHFVIPISSSILNKNTTLSVNLNISIIGYGKITIGNIYLEEGKIFEINQIKIKENVDLKILGIYIPYNENIRILDPNHHRSTTIKREEIERFPGRP